MIRYFDEISRIFLSGNIEATADDVKYYKQNPKELDFIIDKVNFNTTFYFILFLLGIIITAISKSLQIESKFILSPFIKEVLLEITGEIGIAFFGGAIITYLIEFHRKKQYQRNMLYRRKIIELMKQK